MAGRILTAVGRTLCGFGLFLCCGCQLDYYMHLARGQGAVIIGRAPISEILGRPDLTADRRQQFELIGAILQYADSLGLATGDNYTTYYDTGDAPVSWNVSASPPDRFEPYRWEFPLVGSVPYKGFFERQRAVGQRDALIAAGYDAIVRPVGAYSTLGYFSDPVLSGMLQYAPDQLADLILHELTHATAFAPDHIDFNESMATFVGRRASLDFIAQHFGPKTPLLEQARQRRAEAALFNEFMAGTVAALDSLYALSLPREEVLKQRSTVFSQRQHLFATIEFSSNRYAGFTSWEINNARLLSYRRYHTELESFQRVLTIFNGDLRGAIRAFARCAAAADPWQCLRSIAELGRGLRIDKSEYLAQLTILPVGFQPLGN